MALARCKECDTDKDEKDFEDKKYDTRGKPLKHLFCKSCYHSTRVCQICKKKKSIFEFETNQRAIKGQVIRRPSCRDCMGKKARLDPKIRRQYIKDNPPPKRGETFTCPICQKEILVQKEGDVNLDHSHVDGKIRGWLCRKCNTALGTFDDSPTILRRALDWVLGKIHVWLL